MTIEDLRLMAELPMVIRQFSIDNRFSLCLCDSVVKNSVSRVVMHLPLY